MRTAAVVDTNVWVPAKLVSAAQAGRFEVISSVPLLQELAEVMSRPRILRARHLTREKAGAYVAAISRLAKLAPVTGTVNICRDPDDNTVLETALAGGAAHVVTRDEDLSRDLQLLDVFAQRGIQIMTVANFLKVMEVA